MMKKIFILVVFSISVMMAQDLSKAVPDTTSHKNVIVKQNGSWWKKIPVMDQVPYITGVFDGLSLGASIVIGEPRQNDICYQMGATAANDFFDRLDTIQVGDVYLELDSLYADSLNTNVLFDNAFRYIAHKLSGLEPKKLKQMLEMYRKDDSK